MSRRQYRFGWKFFENKTVDDMLALGYSVEQIRKFVLNGKGPNECFD